MTTLLIEDERLAATHLQNLLRKHPAVQVVAVVPSVVAGTEWLRSHPAPNLIFADIQLEDGLSFEIFDAVPVPLIFTTSFNEYALKAFELLSVDYLLKPIQAKGLARALEKRSTPIMACEAVKLRRHQHCSFLPSPSNRYGQLGPLVFPAAHNFEKGAHQRRVGAEGILHGCLLSFKSKSGLALAASGRYSCESIAHTFSPRAKNAYSVV